MNCDDLKAQIKEITHKYWRDQRLKDKVYMQTGVDTNEYEQNFNGFLDENETIEEISEFINEWFNHKSNRVYLIAIQKVIESYKPTKKSKTIKVEELTNECIYKDFDFYCFEPCKGKYCKEHKKKAEIKEVVDSVCRKCEFTDYRTGTTCGFPTGNYAYCKKHVAFMESIKKKKINK